MQWNLVLRALRETSGVTQAGWATQLGYGLRTVQRWEHGAVAPDARATEALVQLCTQLGLLREFHHGALAGMKVTSEWVRALITDARALDEAGPVAPPPLHLPAPLSSFVGRHDEIAQVRRLIGRSRLLTLTGPGGVGKTRLAIQVARLAAADFRDGVQSVELASIDDPSLVPQAIAAVLNVREQPGRRLLATLCDTLRASGLLLVLDNCEHVSDACAEVIITLLQQCDRLRCLATSRVVLGVSGETTWPVPPLLLPDDDATRSDAVELFVQRARAVAPGFDVRPESSVPIAGMCRRLDGLPLAIELAAGWLRVLSPDELGHRLADPLGLLTTGAHDLPPRQRTLRSTLDWSYQLLAPPEQRLLARLSVFAGGAALNAVEAIGRDTSQTGPPVLHSLARLVDASLVQRVESMDAEPRFRLLAIVRDYARERLVASGEFEAVRRQHATVYRDLAEASRTRLTGPQQGEWLDRLEREHDNLRAALQWALEHADAELSGRIAGSLSLFWYHRGHIREGRALLQAALDLTGPIDLAPMRVEMLRGTGLLALHHGDYAAARSSAETGVAIARELRDDGMLAEALPVLGMVARVQEDWSAARLALEEGLRLARGSGFSRGEAISLHHLGLLALEADRDCAAAWTLSERSLTLAQQLGDRRLEGNILLGMARVARARTDTQTARELLAAATTTYRGVNDPAAMPTLLYTRAAIEADDGCFEDAVRLASEATRLTEALGVKPWPAIRRELDSWSPRAV